ncbi:bactofilin family protein [Bizionia sp. KMM 8389]
MFSENKKSKSSFENSSNQNLIAQGTRIVGDLESDGDFRIDGTVEGTIKTAGKIVVGKSGFVSGTIVGTDAYFEGKFSGTLSITGILTLKSTAVIEGDVTLGKLAVEPGATFNVNCTMNSAKKKTNTHERKQTQQKEAQAT